MRTHTIHKQRPIMQMIQEQTKPAKMESLFRSIEMLEKAAGVEPRTTRESFDQTNEEHGAEESVKYVRWLARQAPHTAMLVPFDWTE